MTLKAPSLIYPTIDSQMKSLLIGLSAVPLLSSAALARPVDPGFSRPAPGAHPIARILFAPLLPFVQLQAELSPEKASCWNDGVEEVVGCGLAAQIEEDQERRGDRREERREERQEAES